MKHSRPIILSTLFIFFAFFQIQNAYSQKNITLAGRLQYPGKSAAGIWHHVDSSGIEYALVGVENGISIVDISSGPIPVEKHFEAMNVSIWKELRTWGKFVYAVTEGGGGMKIINLSNLPVSVSSSTWNGNGVISGQFNKAHSLHIENGFAYIFGSNLASGGCLILSLVDPANPTYIGQYNQQYIHDGYVRNDTLWAAEISAGQFAAISVSNKTNPVVLATQQTPLSFPHNTWLSASGSTLFTTDEVNGAFLTSYDVADVNNISELDRHQSENTPNRPVHNVRVLNDFLVNACYGSQVTIVDAARPDNLIETGFYKTGNSLCWDVSPFLPSGKIIAADDVEGLFVFNPVYQRACYLEGNVTDSITGFPLGGVHVLITGTNRVKESNITGNYRTGTADAGLYNVQFSKQGYDTLIIQNVVLQNGIVNILNIKLIQTGTGIYNSNQNKLVPGLMQTQEGLIKIVLPKLVNYNIDFLKLYNVAGKLITEMPMNNDVCTLDVNTPTSQGVYFYGFYSGGKLVHGGNIYLK